MTDAEIRKRLSITDDYCTDDAENPTYYFCQVYADEDLSIELEYFSIRKDDVENVDDFELVEKYAIEHAREILPALIKGMLRDDE